MFGTHTQKDAGAFGVLPTVMLVGRSDPQKFRGFIWLYTGLKQLEIEWNVMLFEVKEVIIGRIHFLEHKLKKYF